MPLFEFICPAHAKFEMYVAKNGLRAVLCPKCAELANKVEFSVPARRDPRHGEG